MAPLTLLSYIQKSCAGLMFVLENTNMDPHGTAAWLEPMFVQALISSNLRCGLMYIPTTLLLYVLKPALHFQCSRFHAFQIEK